MKGCLLFLGTGASGGIPLIGCECEVCRSDLPFNKRLRPSVCLKIEGKEFLIDAGPDFRQQALRRPLPHCRGVTLHHASQVHPRRKAESRFTS